MPHCPLGSIQQFLEIPPSYVAVDTRRLEGMNRQSCQCCSGRAKARPYRVSLERKASSGVPAASIMWSAVTPETQPRSLRSGRDDSNCEIVETAPTAVGTSCSGEGFAKTRGDQERARRAVPLRGWESRCCVGGSCDKSEGHADAARSGCGRERQFLQGIRDAFGMETERTGL